ncbi:hypothetical protein N8912_03125 [Rhodobacteraceae bacterium]|nr:hypothetical protein [Paracoccaceae bacterium]
MISGHTVSIQGLRPDITDMSFEELVRDAKQNIAPMGINAVQVNTSGLGQTMKRAATYSA